MEFEVILKNGCIWRFFKVGSGMGAEKVLIRKVLINGGLEG